jgi:hypothetical protein
VLPYDAVRSADDPEAVLLEFLRTTYSAAADLAGWDRENLECPEGRAGQPRPLRHPAEVSRASEKVEGC